MSLIDSLIKKEWLKTDRIIKAFKEVKRSDFLPEGMENMAEIDQALPIGHDQTISQPMTVAFMLEKLQPEEGNNVLDIGSGSGWTTALLSYIVKEKGKVTAIELIPELKEFGERNNRKYGLENNQFICADGSKGYLKEAPYDRILASASGQEIPQAWKDQLKVGGIIVAPVKNSILVLKKKDKETFETKEYEGFLFVPLVKS